MPGQALLLMTADVDPGIEEEFNLWCDEEHGPGIPGVPGVVGACRYRALLGQPKYLLLYELADVDVLDRPEYLRARPWGPEATPSARKMFSSCRNVMLGAYQHLLTRPDPEPTDLARARALMVRGMDVAAGHEEELEDWYNMEHIPALAEVPGVLRAHRYRLLSDSRELLGDPMTYVALYDVERPEVVGSEEWERRSVTAWTRRMRMRQIIIGRMRNIYERIPLA